MTDPCTEMQLLIQADVDGELVPAEAARVAAHLATCAECTAAQAHLLELSSRLRCAGLYRPTPDALRSAMQRLARSADGTDRVPTRPAPRRLAAAAPFGAGFALAACLVLAVVAVVAPQRVDLTESLVAGHIRALQPGHLLDVVSTDQHTVKPWFDGRLDFAPPVKDFAPQGFPLAGARLDYLANRPVAALVYQRRQHVIDLFVWPDPAAARAPVSTTQNGYNAIHWTTGGMTLWAVSDVSPPELAEFVHLWREH